jgi:hypothetical protein
MNGVSLEFCAGEKAPETKGSDSAKPVPQP